VKPEGFVEQIGLSLRRTTWDLRSRKLLYPSVLQESLANAKVSARQHCVYEGP